MTRGPTIFIERWLACAESSALAFSPRGALQACNPAARPVFAPGGAPSGALDVSPALRPRWETVNVGGTAWSAVFLQEPPSVRPDDGPALQLGLSPRLARVATLVGRGLSDKEIAVQLDLSVSTVRTYVRRIYQRARLNNRAQLVRALVTHSGPTPVPRAPGESDA